MSNEKINFSDLSRDELDKLKDVYVSSRLKCMSENDLILFVKSVIEDQIKGTVGNEEEREAWKEMKEHFQDEFEEKIFEVRKKNKGNLETSAEQKELERRMKFLEERKKENEENNKDMW